MESISAISIICVVISALISVFVPIVFLLTGRLKMKGSLLPALGSVLTFVLIFLVQAAIWSGLNLDVKLLQLLGTESSEHIVVAIRCVYMALIETAGMWLYFFLGRKKRKTAGDCMCFGAGYAVCINLVYSILLVMSIVIVIANAMGKELTFSMSQLFVNASKIDRGGEEFLYYGFRSLFETVFYVSSAMVLFVAVQQDFKWLVLFPFLFNVFHTLPALLGPLKVWYWGNGVVVMIATGIVTIITGLVAYKLYLDYYKVSKR